MKTKQYAECVVFNLLTVVAVAFAIAAVGQLNGNASTIVALAFATCVFHATGRVKMLNS